MIKKRRLHVVFKHLVARSLLNLLDCLIACLLAHKQYRSGPCSQCQSDEVQTNFNSIVDVMVYFIIVVRAWSLVNSGLESSRHERASWTRRNFNDTYSPNHHFRNQVFGWTLHFFYLKWSLNLNVNFDF